MKVHEVFEALGALAYDSDGKLNDAEVRIEQYGGGEDGAIYNAEVESVRTEFVDGKKCVLISAVQ
jgi:hypothetical protein